MTLFTSSKEKKRWIYALFVLIAILFTLVFGDQLVALQLDQNIQASVFLFCMVLIGLMILVHALKTRPNKTKITIWLGITAVYTLLILRLDASERSHLIEYSVLAVFIHEALIERFNKKKNQVLKTAFLAFALTFTIGVLDECIQLFLPRRVFDPIDILFNTLAAFMAIGTSILILWIHRKLRKNL
ncbi:MAG: VanZ family protein [Polaribacter sp.]|nr:VanZ family protein [Polaribacter sp.]